MSRGQAASAVAAAARARRTPFSARATAAVLQFQHSGASVSRGQVANDVAAAARALRKAVVDLASNRIFLRAAGPRRPAF